MGGGEGISASQNRNPEIPKIGEKNPQSNHYIATNEETFPKIVIPKRGKNSQSTI